MRTYREFVDKAKESVEMVGGTFSKPDDDWSAVALIEGVDGLTVVGLDAPPVERATILQTLAAQAGARKVATINSIWHVTRPTAMLSEIERGHATAAPDRTEAVMVLAFDAERAEGWLADILRHEDGPPTLGPWRLYGTNEQLEGLQIDGLREVLR